MRLAWIGWLIRQAIDWLKEEKSFNSYQTLKKEIKKRKQSKNGKTKSTIEKKKVLVKESQT